MLGACTTDAIGGRRQHPNGWTPRPSVTPPYEGRVKGGVQQTHIFDKREQGEGGAEISPPSKDTATGWQDLHQGLIQGG